MTVFGLGDFQVSTVLTFGISKTSVKNFVLKKYSPKYSKISFTLRINSVLLVSYLGSYFIDHFHRVHG